MSSRGVSIAALAALSCSWACALGIGNWEKEEVERAPVGQHFMVLPLNVALPLPTELAGTTDDVFSAIAGHIGRSDYSLETISPQRAWEHWKSTLVEVKSSELLDDNFETAMRVLTPRLRETTYFDALILPALVFRKGRIKDLRVRWDHVVRKIETINVSREASDERLANQVETEILGVSLHVLVFDVDGNRIFEGFGGLDLVNTLDMANTVRTNLPRLRLKEERLKDYGNLLEGVEVAFGPYFEGN